MPVVHSAIEPTAHGTSRVRIVDANGTRFIYVSGQVAMNENREVLHGGDFRRQCEYVFGQLVSRLAQGGAKVSDLVKITVFLSDFRYFPILAEVRKGILPSPGPTSSAIQVAGLAHPDLLIEVEGFAVTESPKS